MDIYPDVVSTPIVTIAVDELLVVRNDIPETVVCALRSYAEASIAAKKHKRPLQLTPAKTRRLQTAFAYVERNRGRRWGKELAPWHAAIAKLLSGL
jgi:hypothetical protein